MRINIHAVNLTLRPTEREAVSKEMGRIASVVRHFSDPIAHIELEHSPKSGGVGASVLVRLATRSLLATAVGGDVRSATELAVDKVERQARKHLGQLRSDERAGADSVRPGFPDRLPSPADLEAARDLEEFRDKAADHVARLDGFLRRERQLNPRAVEAGGRISIPDIVEEALVYVFEHFPEKPSGMSPDRWLVRRGLLILHQELDRVANVSTGSDTPTPPPEFQEDWEELMDLPTYDLRPLEARAAESASTSPEALRSRREARIATAAALRDLPDAMRRALVLRHVESYEVAEVAYVLNATETKVEQLLLEAETRLQDRLRAWRPD